MRASRRYTWTEGSATIAMAHHKLTAYFVLALKQAVYVVAVKFNARCRHVGSYQRYQDATTGEKGTKFGFKARGTTHTFVRPRVHLGARPRCCAGMMTSSPEHAH